MTDYLEIPIVEIGGLKAQYVGMVNLSQILIFIALNRFTNEACSSTSPGHENLLLGAVQSSCESTPLAVWLAARLT